jgi:hypothetical protein
MLSFAEKAFSGYWESSHLASSATVSGFPQVACP